ncbi:MAG: hypothetical protein L0G69_14280 [Brevibacterium sp.]|uniref:hypothetical protein n=1 Tax=Brevibacterium sandarakinum TaxID=629680 RepID=UPI0026517127|nr:hypothetical protein [Brevibacterium sandarakinum]MDN5587719.1 hypothetical protein [Brevibacterium sp.]MDN5634213.1 hypothetical protein [Brevibacterium sp.]MDN5658459.1 hypothetical protein [Brevibacterium sandarakinum]
MSTTVIVTPFGVAEQLAAACVLSNIRGTIVPIGDFTGIVLADTDVQAGNEAAAAISKLSGKHEVLLLVRSEEQIDAGHFRHGARESDVPAGLALKNLPDVLEQLLLEVVSADDVEGSIATSSMTKLQASAATMSPGRAAVARTALLWIVVAVLAGLITAFGITIGLGGNAVAWVVAVFGAIVLGFSLWRIYNVLAKGATQ